MSALAPTTFNALPSDLLNQIFCYLGPSSLEEYAEVDPKTRAQVDEHYVEKIAENREILRAYAASQELQQPLKRGIKRRRETFTKEMQALLGVAPFIAKRQLRGRSILGDALQLQLARVRWNCKAIGLIPFLQAIPEAAECLSSVAALKSSEEKFNTMLEWIGQNPGPASQLRELEIVQCRIEHIQAFVLPILFPSSEKVYNRVPKEISLFTGLKTLSLRNNRLNTLPDSMKGMALEELDIGANSFKKVPPVIPSLRRLTLTGNPIPFNEIAAYVLGHIREGGGDLEIGLDPVSRAEFRQLRLEIPASHSLSMGEGVLFIKKQSSRNGIPLIPLD